VTETDIQNIRRAIVVLATEKPDSWTEARLAVEKAIGVPATDSLLRLSLASLLSAITLADIAEAASL
jgi:hypothetical protein